MLLAAALVLAGCVATPRVQLGPDGKPLPQVYRIAGEQGQRIPFRMLDSVNALRSAGGAPPLAFNAQLNAAAATHARDMSVQNRPWHFGSDGSSPFDRVRRVGYGGQLKGELISGSLGSETGGVGAGKRRPDPRDPAGPDRARDGVFLVPGIERQDLVDAGDGRLKPAARRQGRIRIGVRSRTMA